MSVIECRIQVFDVCIRFQSDRIAEQAEIQITFCLLYTSDAADEL